MHDRTSPRFLPSQKRARRGCRQVRASLVVGVLAAGVVSCVDLTDRAVSPAASRLKDGTVIAGTLVAKLTRFDEQGNATVEHSTPRAFRAVMRGNRAKLAHLDPAGPTLGRPRFSGDADQGDVPPDGGGDTGDGGGVELWPTYPGSSVFNGAAPAEWAVDTVAQLLPWGQATSGTAPVSGSSIDVDTGDPTLGFFEVVPEQSPDGLIRQVKVTHEGRLVTRLTYHWQATDGGALLQQVVVDAFDWRTEQLLSTFTVTAQDAAVVSSAQSRGLQLASMLGPVVDVLADALTPADALASTGCFGAHLTTAAAGAAVVASTAATIASGGVSGPAMFWSAVTFVTAVANSLDCESNARQQEKRDAQQDAEIARLREEVRRR